MSLCNLKQAMERIKIAEKEQPLIIFTSKIEGKVHCLYAKTVEGRHALIKYEDRFVGLYFNCGNLKLIEHDILGAINSMALRGRAKEQKISPTAFPSHSPPQGDSTQTSSNPDVGGRRDEG